MKKITFFSRKMMQTTYSNYGNNYRNSGSNMTITAEYEVYPGFFIVEMNNPTTVGFVSNTNMTDTPIGTILNEFTINTIMQPYNGQLYPRQIYTFNNKNEGLVTKILQLFNNNQTVNDVLSKRYQVRFIGEFEANGSVFNNVKFNVYDYSEKVYAIPCNNIYNHGQRTFKLYINGSPTFCFMVNKNNRGIEEAVGIFGTNITRVIKVNNPAPSYAQFDQSYPNLNNPISTIPPTPAAPFNQAYPPVNNQPAPQTQTQHKFSLIRTIQTTLNDLRQKERVEEEDVIPGSSKVIYGPAKEVYTTLENTYPGYSIRTKMSSYDEDGNEDFILIQFSYSSL